MAHFAELDKDNKVIRVIVVDNEKIIDENGIEQESIGIDFCKSLFGKNTKWVQTSYNAKFRKKYAAIGDTYSEVADIFIPPSPGEAYIWDDQSYEWVIRNSQLKDILEKLDE